MSTFVEPLFAFFARTRRPREGFGDFCQRIGREALLAALADTARKAS